MAIGLSVVALLVALWALVIGLNHSTGRTGPEGQRGPQGKTGDIGLTGDAGAPGERGRDAGRHK